MRKDPATSFWSSYPMTEAESRVQDTAIKSIAQLGVNASLLPLREKVAQSAGRGERSEAAAVGVAVQSTPLPSPLPQGEREHWWRQMPESVPFGRHTITRS